MLLTTHYLEEADALADNIAIMDQGRVVAEGSPTQLKKAYTSTQTLKIECSAVDAALLNSLRELQLDAATTNNGIEVKADNLDIYAIMDILRERQVEIREIQLKQPSLDDVFLQLTGKQVSA